MEPIDSVGSDMRGTILRATHHQRSISVNGMFSRGARWKHQPATGSNIADERCERAQRVWRKRGGGRPRKNGRGGGSPAATLAPEGRGISSRSVRGPALLLPKCHMHVSLSKYLRKAAPTPPGLAPFLFAPVITQPENRLLRTSGTWRREPQKPDQEPESPGGVWGWAPGCCSRARTRAGIWACGAVTTLPRHHCYGLARSVVSEGGRRVSLSRPQVAYARHRFL